MANGKITKRLVDTLEPAARPFVVWDTEVRGFGIRVLPSGRMVYLLRYRVGGGRGGTSREPVIGVHGEGFAPDAARAIAAKWAREVAEGGDPGASRQAQRDAPRMADLFTRYLEEHARPHKKPSGIRGDERLIAKRLLPALGRRKVAEVTRVDIERLHHGLARAPYEANRMIALASKVFSLAEAWGLRSAGTNPVRGVKRYKERRRERFLSAAELGRLGAALAAAERGEVLGSHGAPITAAAIAAIRLLTFTGCRKGEIVGLRWAEVNLAAGRLELADSKTGAKFVMLPPPAMEVLAQIPKVEGNPFVIVGRKAGSHAVDIDHAWRAIREAAGLPEVRLHDLRHSYASIGAAAQFSLPVIGKLLGHRQVATTSRYMHLADDPLRAAATLIGERIAAAMSAGADEGAENVIAIREGRS